MRAVSNLRDGLAAWLVSTVGTEPPWTAPVSPTSTTPPRLTPGYSTSPGSLVDAFGGRSSECGYGYWFGVVRPGATASP